MDNRNLTTEQLKMLDGAVAVIDRALAEIKESDITGAVVLLHDARNAINGIATGERVELGPTV